MIFISDRPYEPNRGGNLTPERPPQKSNTKPSGGGDPHGGAVSFTVCWSLLLSMILISILSWRR